jgi:hypothetical protein
MGKILIFMKKKRRIYNIVPDKRKLRWKNIHLYEKKNVNS